jgi:transposase InsO family protein
MKAAEEFKDKTALPALVDRFQLFQIVGWGWYYLSTVLDDYSRYIVAWKLCASMKTEDVTATLHLALAAAGLGQVSVRHKRRLLSDIRFADETRSGRVALHDFQLAAFLCTDRLQGVVEMVTGADQRRAVKIC